MPTSYSPLVVTALRATLGWFVADSSGFNRLSAAPDDTPLTPPRFGSSPRCGTAFDPRARCGRR